MEISSRPPQPQWGHNLDLKNKMPHGLIGSGLMPYAQKQSLASKFYFESWLFPFSGGSLVSLSPGLGAHDEQRSLRALIHDDDAILTSI